MDKELVSVVINSRNGNKYISKTIQSVLNQTYKKFEIIVFDNMSANPIKNSIKFDDPRLKIIRTEEDLTLGQARNKALKYISGEYVTFLDDDDYFMPNRLQRCVERLKENDNIGMLYSNAHVYTEGENKAYKKYSCKMPSGNIFDNLLENNFILWASNFFKSEVLLDSGDSVFDDNFNIIEDYDIYLRVLIAGFDINYIDECLVVKRYHDKNYSIQHDSDIEFELNVLIKKHKLTRIQERNIFNIIYATNAMSSWRTGNKIKSRINLKKLMKSKKRNKAAFIYILTFILNYSTFMKFFAAFKNATANGNGDVAQLVKID